MHLAVARRLTVLLFLFPAFLATASELAITDEDVSARDVAKILGVHVRKLRISQPEDTRLKLAVNIAMYHQTSLGNIRKLRDHTMKGDGRAPKWTYTHVLVALHDQTITCETTLHRMRLPKEFGQELFGDGVFMAHYTSEPSEFGTVIYERFPDPANKNEKFFLAVSFSKEEGDQ